MKADYRQEVCARRLIDCSWFLDNERLIKVIGDELQDGLCGGSSSDGLGCCGSQQVNILPSVCLCSEISRSHVHSVELEFIIVCVYFCSG